jgi:hypothetical protein
LGVPQKSPNWLTFGLSGSKITRFTGGIPLTFFDHFWTSFGPLFGDTQKSRNFRHLGKLKKPDFGDLLTDTFFEGFRLGMALAAHLKTEIFHRSFDLDRPEGF